VGRPGQDRQLDEQYHDGARLSSRQRLHESCSTAETPWHRFVFDLLPATSGLRILEVGCGRGLLWAENRDRIDPSWALTLTDMFSGMVEETRRVTRTLSCRVVTRAANVGSLPFAAGQFDVVVANHMLYHVSDRARGLAEIARVLVPGGLLVAATNGPGHLVELRELAGGGWVTSASSEFDLVNGPAQLSPWFSAIRVSRHRNRLLVTDPELVIDYLQSLRAGPISADSLVAIRDRIRRDVVKRGGFEIHPQSGVILAKRRRRLPA
jgi:SAM-dependent methyltransferase